MDSKIGKCKNSANPQIQLMIWEFQILRFYRGSEGRRIRAYSVLGMRRKVEDSWS